VQNPSRFRLRPADFVFIPLWILSAPVGFFGALHVFGSDWRVLTVVLLYVLSSVFYIRNLALRLAPDESSESVEGPATDGTVNSDPSGVSAARHKATRRSWLWRLTRLDIPIEFLALIVIIAVTLISVIVAGVGHA
jgi:uncharacterized membrane protein